MRAREWLLFALFVVLAALFNTLQTKTPLPGHGAAAGPRQPIVRNEHIRTSADVGLHVQEFNSRPIPSRLVRLFVLCLVGGMTAIFGLGLALEWHTARQRKQRTHSPRS